MTILEFVQQKLNEGGTDAMLSESLLTATIKRNRVFDAVEVAQLLGPVSGVEINSDSGLLTITMKDIFDGDDAQYQYYTLPSGIYLHETGRYFTVDDTVYEETGSGDIFTFDASAGTLDWETAFTGEVTVKAIGHYVNVIGPYGVMYESIGDLIGWSSKLVNTRGQEFKQLVSRLKGWQAQYAGGFSYGGFRA